METPKLIESNVKIHINHMLHLCRENRIRVYSTILNIFVLIIFLLVFAIGLYYCRIRRLTPYEKYKRQLKDQEYILEKIRHFQVEKAKKHVSLTNLPIPIDNRN